MCYISGDHQFTAVVFDEAVWVDKHEGQRGVSFPKFSVAGGLLGLYAFVQTNVMTKAVPANQNLGLGDVKYVAPQDVVHSLANFVSACGATKLFLRRTPAQQVFQENAVQRERKKKKLNKKIRP